MAKVNSAIGIEYNSHEIRAVELEKTAGGSYEIKAFGREVYSNNVTANGIIADGGLFTVALNDLITRGDLQMLRLLLSVLITKTLLCVTQPSLKFPTISLEML